MTDARKLEALRARYAGAAGADIDDPDFRKAAAPHFSGSDRRKWPFADPATLLDAPCRADGDLSGRDVAPVGVPMDLGATNRAGARLGPRAVRAVGGDHSISRAILAAVGRDRPVGMVHIDAHCDAGGVYEGSKFHGDEVPKLGLPTVIARARRIVGDGPTCVSFHVDSLDPGFAPGTGTPEVGGLSPRPPR